MKKIMNVSITIVMNRVLSFPEKFSEKNDTVGNFEIVGNLLLEHWVLYRFLKIFKNKIKFFLLKKDFTN